VLYNRDELSLQWFLLAQSLFDMDVDVATVRVRLDS
jgi:hypothetical protein